MRYYKELYIGRGIEKKQEKICRRLEQNQFQWNTYLVVIPEHDRNQLEIYQAALLMQRSFVPKDLFVVGIAKGYEEAMALVEEIVEDVYERTKTADARAYIERRQKELEEREA